MYIIKKIDKKITSISDKAWDIANIAEVNIKNWEQYDYIPNTIAKILYSDYGLHVQMQTDEKPLLARYTNQNEPVNTDSCMEFFIRPNENDDRYLNFEFNAFGTMYLAVRTNRYDPVHPDKNKEYFEVKSYVDDKKWIHQFMIPFEFIDEIYGSYTKTMYGNLYKCGDETEREHYASYYPLDPNAVDFHKSEYFGEFILE